MKKQRPRSGADKANAVGPSRAHSRRITVLMSLETQYRQGVLRGICAYGQPVRHWHFRLGDANNETLAMVRRLGPDGIITHAPSVAFARSLMRLGVPVVNCSSSAPVPELPTVRMDHYAVGRMAASYFQQQGFDHYAICGGKPDQPMLTRTEAFAQIIEASDLACHRFDWPSQTQWLAAREAADLRRWLARLPRPAAIFCHNDVAAIQTVAACDEAGLKVPDDVAVLGADNEEIKCQLASPPVSSISLPHEEIGYYAAAWLDRLIEGSATSDQSLGGEQVFQPLEVIARASTDTVAVEDPEVATALQYIRDHRDQSIGVPDVVKATTVSRRVLEARFKRLVNRTIFEEIRSAHVRQARRLLRDTPWPIERVAWASGFNSRERLVAAFREETGQTPGQYRKQFTHTRPAADRPG